MRYLLLVTALLLSGCTRDPLAYSYDGKCYLLDKQEVEAVRVVGFVDDRYVYAHTWNPQDQFFTHSVRLLPEKNQEITCSEYDNLRLQYRIQVLERLNK